MDVVTTCSGCGREFPIAYFKTGRIRKCCPTCCQEAKERGARARLADPEANARYQRAIKRRYREEALRAYGGTCACCNEDRYEFLSIDHIDGGGTQHRREIVQGGISFTRWLAREGYPPGYRVLCHNCNSAYGFYGYCPHQQVA